MSNFADYFFFIELEYVPIGVEFPPILPYVHPETMLKNRNIFDAV